MDTFASMMVICTRGNGLSQASKLGSCRDCMLLHIYGERLSRGTRRVSREMAHAPVRNGGDSHVDIWWAKGGGGGRALEGTPAIAGVKATRHSCSVAVRSHPVFNQITPAVNATCRSPPKVPCILSNITFALLNSPIPIPSLARSQNVNL